MLTTMSQTIGYLPLCERIALAKAHNLSEEKKKDESMEKAFNHFKQTGEHLPVYTPVYVTIPTA